MKKITKRVFGARYLKPIRAIKQNVSAFGVMPTIKVAAKTVLQKVHTAPAHPNSRIALVTFTINPDMAKVWHFFANRAVGSLCDIYCIDSSGMLLAGDVGNANVVHFWNIAHGEKMDYFSRILPYNHIWISDDDIMIRNKVGLLWALDQLQVNKTWAASLLPRSQTIRLDNFEQRAMGSYSFIFDRRIYMEEALSFRTKKTDNPQVNWGSGYFDTCDYAHYETLNRGYKTAILENTEDIFSTFMGTSLIYLQMRRGVDTAEKLKKHTLLIPDNWRRISGTLGSAFCLLKIYQLYSLLFNSEPLWIPPVSEEAVVDIADSLVDKQAKERAFSYFERYQTAFEDIQSLIAAK